MAKFMYLFGGGTDTSPDPSVWMTWMKPFEDRITDGLPFAEGGKVVMGVDGGNVTDFVSNEGDGSGYVIFSADSLDQAVTWTKGCPELTAGGWVKVRPIDESVMPPANITSAPVEPTPVEEAATPAPVEEGSSEAVPAESAAGLAAAETPMEARDGTMTAEAAPAVAVPEAPKPEAPKPAEPAKKPDGEAAAEKAPSENKPE